MLDERDTDVIETCAAELRALLPPEGPVLVLGVGSRRITADALGPRTVQKVLVTMGPQHALPVRGIRPVAAIAPGVSGSTGLTLCQLAGAMVEAVRPCSPHLCGQPLQHRGCASGPQHPVFGTPGCTRRRQTTQGIWTPGC